MAPNSFHFALAVSNIKNNIPLILEMENIQYSTWAELFKITAKSHRVLHHIIPPAKGTEKVPTTDEEIEHHATLDATVLGWIYSTISKDIINTILESDSTTMAAWERLRSIFQDNENSRAVTLEQEFSRTNMDDFSIASAYCQRLKELSDQLRNVGAPVSNNRLVLQLVAGLFDAYSNVGTLLSQIKTMPPFYEVRSMITLKEAGMNRKVGSAAMVANTDEPHVFSPNAAFNANGGKKTHNKNRGRGNGRNGGRNSGRGGSTSGGRGGGGQPQGNPMVAPWGWQ